MSSDGLPSEPDDVDEITSRVPLLSLRQKMGVAISMYLAACTIIFLCQLPALTESWNRYVRDDNTSDILVRISLERVPVPGEVLTYSVRKNLTIAARGNESSQTPQSGTYSVETGQVDDHTGTYLQTQAFLGQSFSQTYNLTMTNDLVTFMTNSGWADETEAKFFTPLNLHLQNLHIAPLPGEQVRVGDSWKMNFERQVDEYGRHETTTVGAQFFLEDQVEVATENGKRECYVIRGVWGGDGISTNLSTGEEIGRTRTEASTTHWIDIVHRHVVKAEKIESMVSDGWQAQLAGAIMGLEDYMSLDRVEARSWVSQVLVEGQSIQ